MAFTFEILFYAMKWGWLGSSEDDQYDQGLSGLLTGVLVAAVCGVILLVLWRRVRQLEAGRRQLQLMPTPNIPAPSQF